MPGSPPFMRFNIPRIPAIRPSQLGHPNLKTSFAKAVVLPLTGTQAVRCRTSNIHATHTHTRTPPVRPPRKASRQIFRKYGSTFTFSSRMSETTQRAASLSASECPHPNLSYAPIFSDHTLATSNPTSTSNIISELPSNTSILDLLDRY